MGFYRTDVVLLCLRKRYLYSKVHLPDDIDGGCLHQLFYSIGALLFGSTVTMDPSWYTFVRSTASPPGQSNRPNS